MELRHGEFPRARLRARRRDRVRRNMRRARPKISVPIARAQTVAVEEQPAEGGNPATGRLDGRRLSRRIEFTPRLVEPRQPLRGDRANRSTAICRRPRHPGARSLRRIAGAEWTRAPRGPRDVRRRRGCCWRRRRWRNLPRRLKSEPAAAPPDDTAALLDRLLRAVARELTAVEAMRAEMKNTPQRPRDAIATAQTLSSLTETLNKLQRMRCGLADERHDDSRRPSHRYRCPP